MKKTLDIKKIFNFKILIKERYIFIIICLFSLFIIYFFNSSLEVNTIPLVKSTDRDSVDTYIPRGFVLVPIEIHNIETLDSLLDKHGVVNLYQAHFGESGIPTFNSEKPVARRIKILRSPKHPLKFAVLAPESDSAQIVKSGGPFYVTIQNPNNSNLEVKTKSKITRKIINDSY